MNIQKKFALILLYLSSLLAISNAAIAAPFPSQYEPRLMAGDEGRLLGGTDSFPQLGESVTGLGDVNGDGFADYAVGGSRDFRGSDIYQILIYGSATTDSLNIDEASVAAEGAVIVESAYRLAAAGDINADGFDDWVFRSGEGEFALITGQAEPYTSTLNVLDSDSSGIVSIINSNDLDGYQYWRILRAGDVNGDGIDDLIVDEPGALWVLHGHSDIHHSTLDLADYTHHQLVSEYYDISAGQDFNADGYTDVVLGFDEEAFYEGLVLLLFGGPDAWPVYLQPSSLNGTNGLLIQSSGAEHSFRLGQTALLSPDLNGDAIPDLILGAYNTLYVLYGGHDDGSAYYNLDEITVNDGYVMDITGYSANAVGVLGDINGDDLGEITIRGNERVEVVYGTSTSRDAPVLDSMGTSDKFALTYTLESDEYRTIPLPLGDVNGDGVNDILIGDEYGFPIFEYTPGMSYDEVEQLLERNGIVYLIFGRSDDGSPASPSDLTAAIGPDIIELRWQAPATTVDGYTILRDGEIFGSVDATATSYIDSNVTTGEAYRYEVVAKRSGASSSPVGLDVVNAAMRLPSIGGAVYSDSLAEIFWAYENVEYIIYRDNVAVDTRWAASYLDNAFTMAGHNYHVVAVNAEGSPVTVRSRLLQLPEEAGTQPPTSPDNPEFIVYSDSTLELFWDPSTTTRGPVMYNVLRNGESIGVTDGNSILDTGLINSSYFTRYEIIAIDRLGDQSTPTRLDVDIDEAQQARKPSEAIEIETVLLTSTSLKLSWDLNELGTTPTQFEIYRNDSYLDTVTEPFYQDNSVSDNQRYSYEIVSLNAQGTRSEPVETTVITPGGPFAPANVTTAVYGPQLIEVFWSRPDGAEIVWSYDVYRNGEFIVNTTQRSYLDDAVTAGSGYSYTVVSVAFSSRSDPSLAAEVTVQDEDYWLGL